MLSGLYMVAIIDTWSYQIYIYRESCFLVSIFKALPNEQTNFLKCCFEKNFVSSAEGGIKQGLCS